MKKIIYQKLIKPILFCFTPDDVHHWFILAAKIIGKISFIKYILRLIYGAPKVPVTVDGITYQGPVLLAAGFDYNGHFTPVLWNFGFAGEEVGSVTAKPCAGNPPPNLARLIKSQSIQVYKGLRNDGVEAIISRLKKTSYPSSFVLGISIAKTNSEECADQAAGVADYVYSFRRLNEENIGDFYTINISCPNAFGGEDFASGEKLKILLDALAAVPSKKPVYIKMPITAPWEKLQEMLKVISASPYQGVVIGNLNKNYNEIDYPEEIKSQGYRGGLSGKPCQKRSNELITLTRQHFPDLTIIGCGGVLTAEDASEKMKCGANLVQLISGMIFSGPQLINEINSSYAKSLRL